MLLRICLVGVLLSMVEGCAPKDIPYVSPERTASVTGTVTYRERSALPADAVVELWLTDAATDALTVPVVAETAFLTDGRQVPIAFDLRYDPSRIDAGRTYALHAVIRHNGQVLFSGDTPAPVLTQGAPAAVEIVLISRPVGFGGEPSAALLP